LWRFIPANIIDDISKDLGVSQTFCYFIIAILALTVVFAFVGWIIGGRRRKKEMRERMKKPCPACGGDNDPDAILCQYCEEML
jgi:predicted permease